MISVKPLPKPVPKVYRTRRVPVTAAVGFVYDDGLVFCADTKVDYPVKANECKLPFLTFDDGHCAVQFAIAGNDINFPKSAITRCAEMLEKMDFSSATIEGIKDTIEFSLAEFYRDHIFTHPDRIPTQLYIQMLVGIWWRNETRLYALHETVLLRVEKYECIGAGEYLSKYLIKQYERANSTPFTLTDAAFLAEYCVKEAIDYDDKCGGEAEIVVMRNSGEIDNGYRTALYPNYDLPKKFQDETLRLIRNLGEAQMQGRANRDAPEIVRGFCGRIQAAEAESRKWGSRDFPEGTPE
jgi:20S proteasome alpha/beta subunit